MYKFLTPILLLLVFTKNTNAQTVDKKEIIKTKVLVNDTIQASYPEGLKGFKKFLERNLNGSVIYDNFGPQGIYRVVVKFNIDTAGKVTDIIAETTLGYGVEAEALKVLKKSGNWVPASLKGKPIKSTIRQPITFMADDGDVSFESKSGLFILLTNTKNELLISVNKIKDETLRVTISNGTIVKQGDGKYFVSVNNSKRVLLEVYDTKKNKFIGSAFFDVIENKVDN